MPAVQIADAHPAARPSRAHRRRPFTPSGSCGPYRLPHDIRDCLAVALAGFKNGEAAFALATFLARFWSTPTRIVMGFPIDRRELAGHVELDLTEARVRGAIRALEAVGFLERVMPATRSRHRLTEAGELHRKPVIYRFGPDYLPLFMKANRRAERAKGGRSRRESARQPVAPSRPFTALPEARRANSPKSKSEAKPVVLMGELRKPPAAPESNPRLEAALERWKMALRESR